MKLVIQILEYCMVVFTPDNTVDAVVCTPILYTKDIVVTRTGFFSCFGLVTYARRELCRDFVSLLPY